MALKPEDLRSPLAYGILYGGKIKSISGNMAKVRFTTVQDARHKLGKPFAMNVAMDDLLFHPDAICKRLGSAIGSGT